MNLGKGALVGINVDNRMLGRFTKVWVVGKKGGLLLSWCPSQYYAYFGCNYLLFIIYLDLVIEEFDERLVT